MAIQSITPFLWYESQAEQAARFYVSLFENSRMTHVTPQVVGFVLQGQPLFAMNGGPAQRLTEAFSLAVGCTEQGDIDRLWEALGDGGSYNVCGWLKDKFGLSWQINYAGMAGLMTGNPERAGRVMAAMMEMTKIDIARLKEAGHG